MVSSNIKKYALKPVLSFFAGIFGLCFFGAIIYDIYSWLSTDSSYTTLLDGYLLIYRNCSVIICTIGNCYDCPQHIAWIIHPNSWIGLSKLIYFVSKVPLWFAALTLSIPIYRLDDFFKIDPIND